MAIRRDAGVALTELCHRIKETFPDVAGERSVWTTGRITLEPGAPSIIPGHAEMLFHELWRCNEDNLPIALHHGSLDVGQRQRVVQDGREVQVAGLPVRQGRAGLEPAGKIETPKEMRSVGMLSGPRYVCQSRPGRGTTSASARETRFIICTPLLHPRAIP